MEVDVASVALVAALMAEAVTIVLLVAVPMEVEVASVALVAALVGEAVEIVVLVVVLMAEALPALVLVIVFPEVEAMTLAVILSACFSFLGDESEVSDAPSRLFCGCLFGDSNRSNDDSAETSSSEEVPDCPSFASSIPEAVGSADCVACSFDIGWCSDVSADRTGGVMITCRNFKFHYTLSQKNGI
jgi:hypothetical protein